ncbi:MAG: beta-galactosidase, partial [Muribaculaceae bacterium]|nr:beta-galactosidase [Muribaculaceae bacterium]
AMSRDQTVFVDDDGKAYQFSSSESNQTMYINELTDDYLRPTGRYTRNFIGAAREAPAVFKRDGKYYVLSSGCTGWDPNVAEIAVADSIMGPWTVIGDPCRGPEAEKTFYAQSTYVQPVQGKKDCYLAMFDRWNKTDLQNSRYVWLPIVWEGNTPTIPWRETVNFDGFEDQGRFEAGNGTFLLNCEPFVVKAAELHYPRIPREYWDHRIKMVKALGMNTVCLYTFWNAHEPMPDQFDFSGQNDLREFIKLCQANDMKVILRPGPYVCAEWEMGGLPWWLLKKKDISLRDNDPYFLERVDKFQKAVADQVGDLTIAQGGPIIMVQVENEYGSYGINKPYVANIRDMLRKNFGNEVALFQCDWSSNFLNNGLNDLVWTINFGTGADIDSQFAPLKAARPDAPLMCSEFWSGWFDKWGANHETRPAADMIAGIDEMLSKDISFSLYMTHGGTSFGHWAGANSPGFAPDVTSYDYDAPVNEQGAPTPKYWALRKAMEKYTPGKQAKVPAAIPTIAIPRFAFTEVAPLFANLPEAKKDAEIKTMEEYDQGFGSILYRTTLPALAADAILTIEEPHDYAQVFVNGKFIGKLDRRLGEKELDLPACPAGATLDILVEAMGRINFGRAIKDFKGITDKVTVTENRNGRDFVCTLSDWTVYNLPDSYEFYKSQDFKPVDPADMPRGVYRATFKLKKPGDTFLNFETFGKGLVYVNGHPMGRIWDMGPQQTLYVPGPWLNKGENEVIVFDVIGPREAASEGLRQPIYDKLPYKQRRADATAPDLSKAKPVLEAAFAPGNGWQQRDFAAPAKGRYLVIEALDANDGSDLAAIAEMHLLDNKGQNISREGWIADYASSEDNEGVNRTIDKIYDLQESTYWQSAPGVKFPHTVVIDLGRNYNLTGIRSLPRMEPGAPGSIKNFRLYLLPQK